MVALIEREVIQLEAPQKGDLVTRRALKWLERYAEHCPDFE